MTGHLWAGWPQRAELRIEPGGLTVLTQGRDTSIPRWRIRAGFRIPQSTETVLMLIDGGRLSFEPEPGEVDALSALGLSEGPPLEVKLQRPSDAISLGAIVGFYSLFVTGVTAGILGTAWPLLLSAVLGVGLALYLSLRRVVVGDDGVLVRRGFRERFVSFAEVHRIDDLTVWLKDGKRIAVTVSGNPADRAAVVHRLHDAYDRYLRRGAEVDARLARAGRDMATWARDLKRQVHATDTFRSTSLPQDHLERVLGNPASGVEQRIGAAIALSSLGEDPAGRIRVAAVASANERVRVALEAAAEGEIDEETFQAALEAESRAR